MDQGSGWGRLMEQVIRAIIILILSGFPLVFLVLGLVFAMVGIARAPRPLAAASVVEKLILWHVFFSIGASFLYNFVCHTFFGEATAGYIGWADSPFQFEVGMASLGYGVVGFIAAFSR